MLLEALARSPSVTLQPVYPDRVRSGELEAVIGPKGYALLVHVVSRGGAAEIIALAATVYGVAEVSGHRIQQQCFRVNQKLAGLGCAWRLAIDDGRVVLL